MPNNRSNARKIALCGITGAIATLCLLLGGFIPLASFTAPAIAGLVLIPAVVEIGYKNGIYIYAVVGIISLFLVANKEISAGFIFFFGYYPILKAYLDKINSIVIRWACKFMVFNTAFVTMYAMLIFLFGLDSLVQSFYQSSAIFFIVVAVIGNVTFCIFDLTISRIACLYFHKYHKRIVKGGVGK